VALIDRKPQFKKFQLAAVPIQEITTGGILAGATDVLS
jgi:hypothetical protein